MTMKAVIIAVLSLAFSPPVVHAKQCEEIVQRWPDGTPRFVNTLDGDGQDGVITKEQMPGWKDWDEAGKLKEKDWVRCRLSV